MDGVYYDAVGNLIGIERKGDAMINEFAINEFAKEVHQKSVNHGWWDDEREFPEIIALCHSELSEALEAYRNGEEMMWMNGEKPDGIGIELCDCIIRILDYLAHKGFDIEFGLIAKHGYNLTRPYKHGGKKI